MNKYFIILIFFLKQLLLSQDVVLNEIMASNSSSVYDEDGDTSDWIELYNNSSDTVNLTGYYLSDDTLEIEKWQFGTAAIAPDEHMVVFASDKDTSMIYWHTNFKISASEGETIILSDSSGSLIDQVTVPVSPSDYSYGREADGQTIWIFQEPTAGFPNSGIEFSGFADSVSASVESGFFSSSFTVDLDVPAGQIFFTTDGSDPGTDDNLYLSAIPINENTILRAINIQDGKLPGPVMTRSYFINENTDLPVVSLVSDPSGLFGDNGIYDNYEWREEREATVEFFEDDKSFGFRDNVVIALMGSISRQWAQKSISVKYKSDKGRERLEYPLFPGFDITSFRSFVLRNAGNDFGFTHIRDAVMTALVKERDIDCQEYRPAVTFINGQYWGIYNIREKISEHYIADHHGVDPDNIDMLENERSVIHGDTVHYDQLLDYLRNNDMTTDSSYNFIKKMIDLDECLLYFASQIYFCNTDWPGNNIKFWRERTENGKWRWLLFGAEFGFDLYGNRPPSRNSLSAALQAGGTGWPNPDWSTLLLRKIVENPRIKNKFINLFADLLNTNFKSDRVVNIINEKAAGIASEISRHNSRFGAGGEDVNFRMIPFAQNRPGFMRSHIAEEFSLRGTVAFTVNSSEGGRVKLNTLMLGNEDYPFSGSYFADVPVELLAIPDPGYKFDGWSGVETSNESSIEVTLSRSTSITASFSPDSSSDADIVINEINYNSAVDFESRDWIELFNKDDQDINIGGWYFSDEDSSHKFFFPAETIIKAGEYLVVVENDSAFTLRFPGVENYIGESGFGFNGSGEFIKLVSSSGQIIDSLTYDDNSPWPIEADGQGPTLELTDPESDNALGENWKASEGHGTPGKINSKVTFLMDKKMAPAEFKLEQNYPNPFNPTTYIRYSIPKRKYIELEVYNLLGKKVKTLYKGIREAGNHLVAFDGQGLSSGVYLYRLVSENFIETKKFILLK